MGTALRNIKTTVKAKRQTLRIIGEPTIIEGTRVLFFIFKFGVAETNLCRAIFSFRGLSGVVGQGEGGAES